MHTHAETKILPYAIEDMYRLVAETHKYPEFLPWVAGARLHSPMPDIMAGGQVLSELLVRFKMFQESYTSRVTLMPPSGEPKTASVEAALERGPFSHLHNCWVLKAVSPNQTEVSFKVEFAFKSRMLDTLITPVFSKATHKMVEAFEAEAKKRFA
jgi:coenzyme Q-binding protein COQ10